jgi:DNA-binding response OmpR family regulator
MLLITPADWSMRLADWLRARGYEVSVISHLIDGHSSDTWLDFDLVLLDEVIWLEMAPLRFEITKVSTPVLILTEERTTKGYSRARKAGAAGYLSKRSEKDSFIREVERVLRKEGKLPMRGRVLIVDDDPRVGSALERRLEQEGFAVRVAINRDDALEAISTHRPHVAVIDFVLKGPKSQKEGAMLEPLDQSGFELIQEINRKFGHAMRVVGIQHLLLLKRQLKLQVEWLSLFTKTRIMLMRLFQKLRLLLNN